MRHMSLVDCVAGSCDIDQIDAGPGGVSMEQFQSIYVKNRFPRCGTGATNARDACVTMMRVKQ